MPNKPEIKCIDPGRSRNRNIFISWLPSSVSVEWVTDFHRALTVYDKDANKLPIKCRTPGLGNTSTPGDPVSIEIADTLGNWASDVVVVYTNPYIHHQRKQLGMNCRADQHYSELYWLLSKVDADNPLTQVCWLARLETMGDPGRIGLGDTDLGSFKLWHVLHKNKPRFPGKDEGVSQYRDAINDAALEITNHSQCTICKPENDRYIPENTSIPAVILRKLTQIVSKTRQRK